MAWRAGRFYDYLRMRSVYRRVKSLSMIIGSVAMVLLTLVSVSIYIHFTMELLREREERFLSVYAASVTGELAEIDRDLSAFAGKAAVKSVLRQSSASGENARLLRRLTLTREMEESLAYYDAVTDAYLFSAYAEPLNLFRGPHGDLDVSALDTIRLFYDTSFFSENGSYLVDAAPFSADPACNNNGLLCLYRLFESGTAKTQGYLLVYLDKEKVFGSLRSADGEKRGVTRMIVSRSGDVIYASDGDKAARLAALLPAIPDQREGVLSLQGAVLSSTGVYNHLNSLGWYAVTILPYSALSSEITLIVAAMLLVLALLFVLYSLMSRSVARSVSVPVNQVLDALRDIQRENLALGPHDGHSDELAEVNNLLNDTKRLLAELITQIRDTERQKYELRLQVLRTQINPHFLVNTLNSIIWLASLQGADNIQTLTASLSAMLTQCMRNTSGVAPIRAEIALLRDYAAIMRFQYMDQFDVLYDVEPAVEEAPAPVLFLQPLVENALVHGRDASTPLLTIRIAARMEGDHIRVTVADDGKGMTADQLRELAEPRQRKKGPVQTFTSIGVSNIRERMKLLYQDRPCSLTVESVENRGVTVTLILPLLPGEEEHEANSVD